MRLHQARRSTRKTYLVVLLVASIVMVVIPSAFSGKLISLVQILIPFQHGAAIAGDAIDGALDDGGRPVSRDTYDELQRKKAALEHRVAALAMRVEDLEREVDILTATRLWNAEGGGIGTLGKLIPAEIIAGDLLPWRSSQLVNAGTLKGVDRGSPVTSCEFTIDEGKAGGVSDGMAVLLGEVFIGHVEQAGTHAARVRLLSDVGMESKVRIGRFTDDGFASLDSYFWLTGRGSGIMEIGDAQKRDVDAGLIAVGDFVLSDPSTGALPTAMTIGKISAIEPDRDNPLHSILTIEGAVDVSSLRRVYVYAHEAEGIPDPRIP